MIGKVMKKMSGEWATRLSVQHIISFCFSSKVSPFKKTAYKLFANETDTRYASVALLLISLLFSPHYVLFMIVLTPIDYY